MTIDNYEPCPCLSGKKLKFCCQNILDEMMKVMRLSQSNQPRMALKALDSIDEKAPLNPWVATSRATIYLDEMQYDMACECLEPVVREHPKHPVVLGLLANASFAAHGYEVSRSIIHRAFAYASESLSGMMGSLAIGIAQIMLQNKKHLAAREHFALGLRLMSAKHQQEAFMLLMNFDRNASVPFVFRGVHHLEKPEGNEELQTKFLQAEKICELGAWSLAIRVFSQLTELNENNAALFYNLGLCQAWDGDEVNAVKSLGKASALFADYQKKVDCETLAQLLDAEAAKEKEQIALLKYRVESVSRLLTKLDEHPNFIRADVENEFAEGERPSAMFSQIDREMGDGEKNIDRLEDLPVILGELMIIDSELSDSDESRAVLFRIDRDHSEICQKEFESAVGDLVAPNDSSGNFEFVSLELPAEYFPMEKKHWFGNSLSMNRKRNLLKDRISRFVYEEWPSRSLSALDGQTPQYVSENDHDSVKLAAAILVLDAFCDQNNHSLDSVALAEKLKIRLPESPDIADEVAIQNFTSSEFIRIDAEKLDNKLLEKVLNRALLLWHHRSLEDVLKKTISQLDDSNRINKELVYRSLANIMRDQGRHEEEIEWTIKGVEHVEQQEDSFMNTIPWLVRLTVARLNDPSDPELIPLLNRIQADYFVKLPELRENLNEILQQFDVDPPWELAAVEGDATTEDGIWTPSQDDSSEKEESTLWLPGQE